MNDILYQRIVKMIALTYALEVQKVWDLYVKINSIDKIIDMAKNDEI